MSSAKLAIIEFLEKLRQRAQYGIAGEKPLAIVAVLKYVHENGLYGKRLLELIDESAHSSRIRSIFKDLANQFGRISEPSTSWNVITGKNRELQNAIIKSQNVNEAFSKLTREEVESLLNVSMQRLKKSTEMFSRPTEPFGSEAKRRTQERDEQEGFVFREHKVLAMVVNYLQENGWGVKEQVRMNGGYVDVSAEKDGKKLLIEAKGEDRGGYTSAEMNFQMGLGQVMSRMKYRDAEYCLAFPLTRDFIKVLRKYQGSFAFQKLGIYLIPVKRDGTCHIVPPHDSLKFLKKLT